MEGLTPAKDKTRRRSPVKSDIKAPSEAIKLGELSATAICGNDISSSCLYVSALAIVYAGKYAWVALLVVAAVLYLFRRIYGEVVGALPLNGGAYNALLNTTSKSVASMAACLTLLSYMATAVISANEAMHYVHALVERRTEGGPAVEQGDANAGARCRASQMPVDATPATEGQPLAPARRFKVWP